MKTFKTVIHYSILVLIALFLTGPFLWLLITSLKSGQNVFQLESLKNIFPSPATLENFKLVWTSFQLGDGGNQMVNFFQSTVIIVSLSIFLQLVVSSLAAYPLARLNFPGKYLVSILMLSAMMLPVQAGMIVNFITIRQLGLFDTYMAVIIPGAVSIFGIFIMRQAYIVIPNEIEDAARIDGCEELSLWYRIMLPLTKPALATLAIFSFVTYWNSFMWPLVVLKSEKLYPISVGLVFLANTFDSNFKLVAAASVLSMIPVIIVFLMLQKYFIKGITAGAVK
jgi:putative chitobiose transport system permease protein